jgi:hypothetical protein
MGKSWKGKKEQVIKLAEETQFLLHNNGKKVDPDIFKQMPKRQWKSLQLIYVEDAHFGLNPWQKPYCLFKYSKISYELKVTDPIAIDKIEKKGKKISEKCLLTVSMATPFKSPAYEKEFCWKMVAGIIEL